MSEEESSKEEKLENYQNRRLFILVLLLLFTSILYLCNDIYFSFGSFVFNFIIVFILFVSSTIIIEILKIKVNKKNNIMFIIGNITLLLMSIYYSSNHESKMELNNKEISEFNSYVLKISEINIKYQKDLNKTNDYIQNVFKLYGDIKFPLTKNDLFIIKSKYKYIEHNFDKEYEAYEKEKLEQETRNLFNKRL